MDLKKKRRVTDFEIFKNVEGVRWTVYSSSAGQVEVTAFNFKDSSEVSGETSIGGQVGADKVGAEGTRKKEVAYKSNWKLFIAGDKIPPRIQDLDKSDLQLITTSAVTNISEYAGHAVSVKDLIMTPAKTTHTITKTSDVLFVKPCPFCGAELKGAVSYCPWCGKKLGWDTSGRG